MHIKVIKQHNIQGEFMEIHENIDITERWSANNNKKNYWQDTGFC